MPPIESRYIAYSSLILIGLVVILGCRQEKEPTRFWRTGFFALLALGLIAANLWGLRQAREWRSVRLREKFLLQTAESQPDEALTGLYFVPKLRRDAAYLQRERLGPFHEPRDLLILTRWKEGSVAGEILPGRPLEQTYVCDVDTLWEAGPVLSTYGRQNHSTVAVSLWEGGRKLGSRTVPLTGMADSTYVSISPNEPLRDCRGRQLTFRMESADAAPGNAASAWLYPSYYQGQLRQPGESPPADRVVGIEVNAYHFGLPGFDSPKPRP